VDWGCNKYSVAIKIITGQIAAQAAALRLGFPMERVGHMIGLDLSGGVSNALKAELKNENIFVGYRGESIRVSPYLYTTSEDIEKLFDVLRKHV